MNIMFGWVMHEKQGFKPEICNLDGEVVYQLPKQETHEQARGVFRRWAKENPETKLIMMPGDDRLR